MRPAPSPPDREPPAGGALALGFFGALAVIVLAVAAFGPLGASVPFGYAAAAWLASRALWRVAEARYGPATSLAVRGAGWAGAAALALLPLGDPYALAAPGAAALLLGAFLFAASAKSPRGIAWLLLGLASLAAGYPLLAPALLDAMAVPAWRYATFYGVVVASLVLTRLARATALAGNAAGREVTRSELRNFFVVLPFTAYFVYRPVLEGALTHFEVYEWSLGVALAFYVAALLRGRFRDGLAESPWTLDATRHAGEVTPLYDPAFREALETFEAFVERGEERPRYLAFWRGALARAGVAAHDAEALLARAGEAPDAPALARWRSGAKGEAVESARAKRQEAHRALLQRIVRSDLKRDAPQQHVQPDPR